MPQNVNFAMVTGGIVCKLESVTGALKQTKFGILYASH